MIPAVRILLQSVAAAVLVFLAGCQDGGVTRLAERAPVSFDRMVAEASRSRVIVAGETHDNRDHHDLQLRIIRTLHEGGTVLAVGLEMFRAENQELLDKWWRWGMPTEQFEELFRENCRVRGQA